MGTDGQKTLFLISIKTNSSWIVSKFKTKTPPMQGSTPLFIRVASVRHFPIHGTKIVAAISVDQGHKTKLMEGAKGHFKKSL